MHLILSVIPSLFLLESVSSDSCSKTCTSPFELYEATCVCLPVYVKASCMRGDHDRCERVIAAGLCSTVTYAASCATGCGLCDDDYAMPTGPDVFFGPDASARELFDTDCGSPPGIADGTVAPTTTTFTSIAEYTCNGGYTMTGHGLSKCQHDGSWSALNTVCNDINECDTGTHDCDPKAACTNNPGSFSCTCNAGYGGDGTSCADIDECDIGTHDCDPNAACTNNPGSFSCSCNLGYNGNGTSCTDIDECDVGLHNCHANAACTNNPGSFSCACNGGYIGDGTVCEDINECDTGTHDCDPKAACTNNPGSFSCTCNAGYGGDGTSCADINECDTGTHDCDPKAACTNNPGSFSCTCNAGYGGDGTSCADIDECDIGTHDCDPNAACTNNPGSFSCSCNLGYNGNGTSCTDIDECDVGLHNCHANAACTNNPGSFSCACNGGYIGDGTVCEVKGVPSPEEPECPPDFVHNCPSGTHCAGTPESYKCGTWVQSVTAFSSEYSYSSGSPINGAKGIIGEDDLYPQHTDSLGAWSQPSGAGISWIIVKFPVKLQMTEVDVYQTYNPGYIKSIETEVSPGSWFTLWSTNQFSETESVSRIFSPIFKAFPTFPSNNLRITVNAISFSNIDAVRAYWSYSVE